MSRAPADRTRVLGQIAELVPAPPMPRCVRVAVDGVDGVGKTAFASELGQALRARGRQVVQVSADGFHQPRALRHSRGRDSAEGFWLDSYDYSALVECVLEPFAPHGSRRYRPAAHDLLSDDALDLPEEVAPSGSVLVVEGLFLHRDELVNEWDFSVFLYAPFSTTFARMANRDGSDPDPSSPSNARYVGGQRLYLAACSPWQRADVVVDNTDFARPTLLETPASPRAD